MRVLIIGSADTIWVKTMIKKTHLSFGDDISILSSTNSVFTDYYQENNVKVFPLKAIENDGISGMINNLKVLFKGYDLLIVHYVGENFARWGYIGSIFTKKLLLSFWGSDILREERANKAVKKAIKASYAMVITTDDMIEKFHVLYGNSFDSKIRRAYYGSNGIELISGIADIDDIKQYYGIDKNKIVVSIGHNKMVQQQHLKVLQEILKLPIEIRNKIHLVLRLTYGNGDDDYVSSIKQYVKNTECSSTILESFMTDKEVAEITAITDIFIHAQTTDARSASMCEHLYAKCLVVNPSWIKYSDLEDSVFYLKFNSFDELPKIISNNLVNKNNSPYKMKLYANTDAIYNLCSWDRFIPEWRKIYAE